MKKILFLLLLLPCLCTAQTGSWHAYMAYKDVQQIVKGDERLYVRASNGLYSYSLTDHSITTYDKIRQLSDSYITNIAWNKEARRLIVVYNNSNIDLLDGSDNVTNISSLYLKSMTQDKTVNATCHYGAFTFLATNFGVAKVNMRQAIITESYILNTPISRLDVADGMLYALKADGGYLQAKLTKNLINPANWEETATVPDGLFQDDLTDWNDYHDLVATLQPGGPDYNYFYNMRFKHGRLYTVGGAYNCVIDGNRPGIVQILKDGNWTVLGNDVNGQSDHLFQDIDAIDSDPNDPDHIFIGGKTGLYEFRNGSFTNEYTIDNSPLTSSLGNNHGNAKNYTIVQGLTFDNDGNLWCLNSGTYNYFILKLDKENNWSGSSATEMINGKKGLKGILSLLQDSRGYFWFVNYHWEVPCVVCYDPQTDKILQKITDFINQDGGQVAEHVTPHCVVEDLNHDLWIGTEKGPVLFNKENITVTDPYVTQVKVPRNDGTDYADYLMAGIAVSCMAIDGANRKWFGTMNDGVYLISADNMKQLQHFTTENSPLLSNTIESIAIDGQSGEVFIGTDVGLCSYMSDATTAVQTMESDNFIAYPNPVPSTYNGLITIKGFSIDADVKVVSVSGKLIAQGRSNGGTFTWDGRDHQGRRVASGIYMVVAATSSGEKGAVCKIAIIN